MPRRSPDPRQLALFESPVSTPSRAPDDAPGAEPAPGRVAIVPAARLRVTEEEAWGLFERLRGLLGARLGHLTLTANHSTLFSMRRDQGGHLRLRAHWCFALVSPEIAGHLALLASSEGPLRAKAQARASVRAFFVEHQPPTAQGHAPRATALRPRGKHHDLLEIRDQLNREYFEGALEVDITWGRKAASRRRRRRAPRIVRLGSYDARSGHIRIHPCLDHSSVPRVVVASVVHHEMLHAVIPPEVVPGRRRRVHPPELRRREREFPEFDQAEDWLRRHLGRLVRC